MRKRVTEEKRTLVTVAVPESAYAYRRGIARYAHKADWILAPHFPDKPASMELDWASGAIVALSEMDNVMESVLGRGLPVVDLFANIPDPRAVRLIEDSAAIGRKAAQHLLDRGFRTYAFVAPRSGWWPANARLAGFRSALRKRGFRCHEIFTSERDDNETVPAYKWLAARLRQLPRPLGIMAWSDYFALCALRACRQAGLRIPDDVAVIGCDNDDLICDFSSPPLSSVDTNMEEHAYRAAALLDRMIQGKPVPRMVPRVPCVEVVARQSTDVLVIEDPRLASAVRKLRSSFADPLLSVETIAASVGMSRRWLDAAFVRRFHRTVSNELKRLRLERAKALLAESRSNVNAVARACGYGRAKHLRDTLIRATGLTPVAFRRKHRGKTPGIPTRSTVGTGP